MTKNKKSTIFYHVTNKQNLQHILHSGLRCKCGVHQKLKHHTDNVIYLTKRKDLPIWMGCFVDGTIVLEVNTLGYTVKRRRVYTYCGYVWEYASFEDIPPDRLRVVYNEEYVENTLKHRREYWISKGRLY